MSTRRGGGNDDGALLLVLLTREYAQRVRNARTVADGYAYIVDYTWCGYLSTARESRVVSRGANGKSYDPTKTASCLCTGYRRFLKL
jgi:hypothetical protein